MDIDGSATGDNAEKSGEPEISFSGAFNGSLAFDRKRYFPTVAGKNPKGGSFVKPLVQVGITPRISVGFEAKESVRVPGSTELLPPLERVGIAKGKAAIGFPITYDIGTQIAYSFPAIAGPIGLLQGTGLNLSITSEPTAGASFTRKWTTRYERDMPVPAPAPVISGSVPPDYGKPAGTFDPKRLAPRRGLLGEDFVATDEDPTTQLGILLGITGKLNATYENKYVGAGAVFTVGTVADSKTACGSFPTLEVTANRNGDSPAYTRVKGGIKAGGEVFGRVWRAKIGKSFTWLSIPIDRPLNTEALFHLAPYDMTESIVSTLTAPPAVWIGTEPHLVSDFHSLGGYSTAASGGAQMLLFTDPDSTGGVVKLKAVLQSSPPAWGSPVEIASAADILDMVVHPLSGGGWMAVWSELGAGSLTEIAPASTLMFSTSATGSSWSAPAVIGSVSETVFDLHLVPMPGGELGLVYFSTDRGPGASIVDIGAHLYSGASWGGVQSLFNDVYLTGWDVAGPGFSGTAPAQIVGFTDVGGLVAAGWDGRR